MNRLRITICLIFCMITAAFTGAASSDGETVKQYEYEAQIINAIGVLDENDEILNTDGEITRAQFVYAVCLALGIGEPAKVRTQFDDVPNTHWACGYIYYMANIGIISNDGGMFYPDEPINYAQALKILVETVGYGELAQAKGGYPTGYAIQAADLKLTQGISCNSADVVTRDMLNKLIYNMCKCKIINYSIENNNGEYSKVYKTKGEVTVLKQYRDIEFDKGKVTANSYTTLKSANSMPKGMVTIKNSEGEETFYTCDTNASDLLGYNVEYYYYEVDGEKYLAYVGCEKGQNAILEINSEDFIDCRGGNIEFYDESGKTHCEKISIDASLIYNGICKTPYGDEDIDFGTGVGKITLIDSENDGEYECVFMEKYEFCVADYTSSANKYILSKYNLGYYDLEKYDDDEIFVMVDGEKKSIDEIYEYDPLYICRNDKFVKIYINSKMVRGTIDAVSDDECIINGERYEYSDTVMLADEADLMAVGKSGKFYFDIFGRIAVFEKSESDEFNYGALMAISAGSDIEETVYLKIYTKNDKAETFKLENKVIVNGVSKSGAGMGDDDSKAYNVLSGGFPKAVKWSVNDKGNINKIYVYDKNDTSADALRLTHTKDLRSYTEQGRFGYHRNGTATPVEGYAYDIMVNNAVYIQVPNNSADAGDEDYYTAINPSALEDDDTEVMVEGYDADEMNEVALCLEYCEGSTGKAPSNWNTIYPYAVKKIYQGVNSENEACIYMEFSNGKTYPVKTEYTEAEKYNVGDFVKYQLDDGEIFALKRFVDISQVSEDDLISSGMGVSYPAWMDAIGISNPNRTDAGIARTLYGIPWKVNGNKMVLARSVGTDENGNAVPIWAEVSVNITTNLCVCEITGAQTEKAKYKVRAGTLQDLKENVYGIAGNKAKLFNSSTYGLTRANYLIIFKD